MHLNPMSYDSGDYEHNSSLIMTICNVMIIINFSLRIIIIIIIQCEWLLKDKSML